jgi:hypothetical protein
LVVYDGKWPTHGSSWGVNVVSPNFLLSQKKEEEEEEEEKS